MLLRRLMTVVLSFIVLIAIGLFGIRFMITRSITCLPNCVGTNLMAHDLQGLDMQGSKLMEAQLQNADLRNANLREVDLSGANLYHANLRNADLTDARLIGADLSGARLEGSILTRADLSGANLSGADLTNVDLRDTLVSGATFVEAKLTNVNFQGVNLSGLNFSKASLPGANLSRAKLAGASLSQSDLSGAILTQADLTGAWLNLANLVGANLANADLSGSSLLGAQVASANLQNSKAIGAILVGAQLDGANVRGANLSDARTSHNQLSARLLNFLNDARTFQNQFPELMRSLDPVLQELSDLQRQELLLDANLNGLAFDSQTIWPAAGQIVAGAGRASQLALAPSSETTDLVADNMEEVPSPRQLAVNFYINSIREIVDSNSEYNCDFYIDLFWQEPGIGPGQDVSTLDPATLWNPHLRLVNSLGAKFLYEMYTNSIEPDSNVRFSYRAIGNFVGNFDLRHFPFDQQKIVIELEPQSNDSDSVILQFIDRIVPSVADGDGASTTSDAAQTRGFSQLQLAQPLVQEIAKGRYVNTQAVRGGWRVDSAHVIQSLYLYPHDQASRSRFAIEVTLARQSVSYVWKYMVPLILLALIGWSICLIDATNLALRFWLLVILLICVVVLQVNMRLLPQVPYLTYLDRFLLLHYGVLTGLIAWIFAIKFFQRGQAKRVTYWLNQGLIVGYPIAYIGLNLLLYLR